MFCLHVKPAAGEPFDHLLDQGSVVVGRSSISDLVLADPFLSRRHTLFFVEGAALFVEDLRSSNGTLLNGRRVAGPTEVRPGDVVTLSGSSIEIRCDATADLSLADLGAHTIIRSASDLVQSASGADAARIEGEEALRRYAGRLKLLNEVHQALGRPIVLGELLNLILDRIFDHLHPEQGAIFLKRPDGEFERVAGRSLAGPQAEHLCSRSLLREVAEKQNAALVLDAQTDQRFAHDESVRIFGIQSLLAAPLLDPDGSLGMIVLTSRLQTRQFSEEDLELLVSLAAVAALRIRNVALAEEAAERRRLEEELALARQIQVAALPRSLPEVPGYELRAGSLPSRRVSGDYYAVQTRRDGRECVLMIADVAGKGLPAALLVAVAGGALRRPHPCRPAARGDLRRARASALRAHASREVRHRLPRRPRAGDRRPALRQRRPQPGSPAAALGSRRAAGAHRHSARPAAGRLLRAAEVTLAGGDLLFLYTDGITEAANAEEEEFGLPRLVESCLGHGGESLEGLAGAIERDLERFVLGLPYADDRTVVLLRRRAGLF